MRAVIYARYSSDLQREASIEDQIEICRRYAQKNSWTIVDTYSDAAISGATRFRPSFQRLLADAGHKRFDIVVCEAIDRLGRRLADTADLQDQLAFHGIGLFTPFLGEITQIHVAVMGMMAQMALKDLGEKTKRGQLGRILKGLSAGGIAFGYRKIADAGDGAGRREIVQEESATVMRIFTEYSRGKSPEAIARDLNNESIPGPHGRPWSNTTLRGQAKRGTGLLNNSLYNGKLVWNRCSYIKDPRTGKRVARPNPPEKWEALSVPELRIVPDDLWAAVKERQATLGAAYASSVGQKGARPANALNSCHRPRFLLSGLLRCGCCGGGYTIIAKDRYGCAIRKQKGTCQNARTIMRHEIEARALDGLKEHLLQPELVAAFVEGFQADMARARAAEKAERSRTAKKRMEIDRKLAALVRAIEDGLYQPSMKERIQELEKEKALLPPDVPRDDGPDVEVLLHPRLPAIYKRQIENLTTSFDGPDKEAAFELFRSMIDHVELRPRKGAKGLDAVLHGELAAILQVCTKAAGQGKRPASKEAGRQPSMVAGERNQLYLLLRAAA
jgi:site-specific DNA recombinase